jgi:hypothetical protein
MTVLSTNTCLILAERRISDAAYAKERGIRSPIPGEGVHELVTDLERQAREFLEVAKQQGWTGDADVEIAKHWKVYLP